MTPPSDAASHFKTCTNSIIIHACIKNVCVQRMIFGWKYYVYIIGDIFGMATCGGRSDEWEHALLCFAKSESRETGARTLKRQRAEQENECLFNMKLAPLERKWKWGFMTRAHESLHLWTVSPRKVCPITMLMVSPEYSYIVVHILLQHKNTWQYRTH